MLCTSRPIIINKIFVQKNIDISVSCAYVIICKRIFEIYFLKHEASNEKTLFFRFISKKVLSIDEKIKRG